MISLLYLKHAFNESDEGVVERWAETPTWQYLSGLEYFEHRWPCDPTAIGKFRRLLGEEGVEELLAQTINVAVTLKLIAKKDLAQVIVDSTVQQKAVAHPTDSKLLETARAKLVEAAKQAGIELKQTYAKEGHRVNLHFMLHRLNAGGLTWEAYCDKLGVEPLPAQDRLPVGFVFQFLQNLKVEDPNKVFATPNLSEMVRVNDDSLLRTLVSRVESVRYGRPRDLDQGLEDRLMEAVDNFATALCMQKVVGAGGHPDGEGAPVPALRQRCDRTLCGGRRAGTGNLCSRDVAFALHKNFDSRCFWNRRVSLGTGKCRVSALRAAGRVAMISSVLLLILSVSSLSLNAAEEARK